MNTKQNQRFRAMDRKLIAAALHLLQEGSLESLTVKQICQVAGVNRSTFYAHYSDLFDLLRHLENELYEELREAYADVPTLSQTSILLFLQHIEKHQYFYRAAFPHYPEFPHFHYHDTFYDHVVLPYCQRNGLNSQEERQYCLTFFQAGLAMVLRRWVNGGCQEPAEEIAALLWRCLPFPE